MRKHRSLRVLGLALWICVAAAPAWAGVLVYANVSNGPSYGYSRVPGTQIGDELLLTQGGILDAFGFSVYNSVSSIGSLMTADLTIDFWNFSGTNPARTLAGTFAFDDYDFGPAGLPVGDYATFLVTGVSNAQTISLTNDVLAILTISDVTGGADRVGQLLFDPPTVGASDDYFYVNNTGIGDTEDGWYWFGGNPVANFYWSIEVNAAPVPEPASIFLLGAGLVGLLGFRKRNRQ
jgi:hypothetical protein